MSDVKILTLFYSLAAAPQQFDNQLAQDEGGTAGVSITPFIARRIRHKAYSSPDVCVHSRLHLRSHFLRAVCSDEDEDDDDYARKMSWLSQPLASLVGGGLKDGTVAEIDDSSQELRE